MQTPPLGVPSTIDIIFHFMLTVICLSFNFRMYLESSVQSTYFLWWKFLVCFLKRSLNFVSEILKYFLSGLLSADATAFHTMFVVKRLLSSGHSALFPQLYLWLLEVGWIILRMWEAMTDSIFLQQLYLNFIEFLLKIFDILWGFEKWRLFHLKNFLPIFVSTIFENGGLNYITSKLHITTKFQSPLVKDNPKIRHQKRDSVNLNAIPKILKQQWILGKSKPSKPDKQYFGIAETSFKDRCRNHSRVFRHKKYVNSTELSKYTWKLKSGVCKLCFTENFGFWKILTMNIYWKKIEVY